MRPLALLLVLLVSSAAWAQPRLVFETPRHDFGTFDEGGVVTHVFSFTNEGDAPLVIESVSAACGCTTPEWTREEVRPGGSGQVTVAYDSDARPGPFEKTVRVDAGDGGDVTLRIAGDVTSVFVASGVEMGALTFATDHLEIGQVAASERASAVFRFQHTGDRPVRIQSVRFNHEGAEAVYPERPVFPGDVAAVLVYVEPSAGPVDLLVTVETDEEADSEKRLRVTGAASR